MPSARARPTSASVSALRPQFSRPATLWWEMCTGTSDSRAIAIASLTASAIMCVSPRTCDVYGRPVPASARLHSWTISVVCAYAPGV